MPSDPYTNPFTLPGTKITTMTNFAQKLSARTHRLAANTENPIELWYFRASAWALFPVQPITGPDKGITLTQAYQQPAALTFTLPDPNGYYQTENLESPYNYDGSGNADALVDDARKIVLRVGTNCYSNLAKNIAPTSTLATTGGSSAALSNLTAEITSGNAGVSPSFYCHFGPSDTTPFVFTIDLGSAKTIRHAVVQLASLVGTCSLPASVQVSFSTDNLIYNAFPARPVGGAGSAGVTPGDWGESVPGQDIELAFCDLDVTARYVKFTVTPTGAQTIWISTLAVYGGSAFATLGMNLFTGYMGDEINFENVGFVECVAVDVLKRLADNNDNFLTAAYRLTGAGGVELGDIVHSLLTSTAYWKSLSTVNDYDHPLQVTEIGWSSGSGLTGLQYPLWQGQTNSILGYCQELFAVVGWHFYADGNGTIQAVEPPYTQRLPDRVCIAANDGNYDVSHCVRHRTGKQMRNRVIVQTGVASPGAGSVSVVLFDPNSTSRYGTRTTRITDPLAQTDYLRKKVAEHFLRDYDNNLQTLTDNIRPTFDTRLKHVIGKRAPARPNLYAKSCSVVGFRRKRELWSLMGLTHNITYGQWRADAEYIPYIPQVGTVPNLTALNTVGGHTDQLTAVFDVITDASVVLVKAYVSTTDEFHGFAIYGTTLPGTGSILLTGLTPAIPYWVYLVSVDDEGMDSLPSTTLEALPGSQSQAITCYTVDDFTCDSVLTSGPDSQGYYTYQFLALWNAPACGMTEMYIRANLDGLPVDDAHWAIGDASWHWWGPDRIHENLTWDNTTVGQLDFVVTMRTTSNLSGHTLYFAIWNSTATRTQHLVRGNFDTTVVV